MNLKLYNTMSRQVEEVARPEGRELRMYACGITAYDYAHLGNLRRYVMDDVLLRVLRYDGYQVKHVQNVTDVGHLTSDSDTGIDKLEKGAARDHKSVTDVARFFEKYFFESCDKLHISRPTVVTRATEYIDEQLRIAVELEKKGYAYLIEGDGLYFDTSRFEHYGELARLNLAALQEGARVEKVAGKRHPTDFAVWKLEAPGENRQMVWPSPWGERSFPGWHLECVAMALDQLGMPVDIHSGGVDHIPVHHTNEIAQAESYTGKRPFVKHWVHHNFMRIDNQKMSKSLGNIYRLEDVVAKGFTPEALRYLFLMSHYRHELNFTWEAMAAAQTAYDRLVAALAVFERESEPSMTSGEYLTKTDEYRQKFLTLVNDDLNVPAALATISEILKANLGPRGRYDLLIDLDEILGLDLRAQVERKRRQLSQEIKRDDLEAQVADWLSQRESARADKDWARADFLRTKIEEAGYRIIDTLEGAKVQKTHDQTDTHA
ncbi:cysteine--tRNA ligase [bacterium]|nr:cysteine--tRNA ligase [bacterium]